MGFTSNEAILGGNGSLEPKAHSIMVQRSHMASVLHRRRLHRHREPGMLGVNNGEVVVEGR